MNIPAHAFRVDPATYGFSLGLDRAEAGDSPEDFQPVDYLIRTLGVQQITIDLIGVEPGRSWQSVWLRHGQQWILLFRIEALRGFNSEKVLREAGSWR